jgi:hypothetical protein
VLGRRRDVRIDAGWRTAAERSHAEHDSKHPSHVTAHGIARADVDTVLDRPRTDGGGLPRLPGRQSVERRHLVGTGRSELCRLPREHERVHHVPAS